MRSALNESAVLLRQTSNLQQSTLNALKNDATETEKRIEKVGSSPFGFCPVSYNWLVQISASVDGMRRSLEGIRSSLKSPLNDSAFADVEKSADHVNSLIVDSAKVDGCLITISLRDISTVSTDAEHFKRSNR